MARDKPKKFRPWAFGRDVLIAIVFVAYIVIMNVILTPTECMVDWTCTGGSIVRIIEIVFISALCTAVSVLGFVGAILGIAWLADRWYN